MKAECTWGEGPDVLVNLDGSTLMLYEKPTGLDRAIHGFVSEGSVELTTSEAFDLLTSLIVAIRKASEMNLSYRDFAIKEQNDRDKHSEMPSEDC